MEDYGIHLTSEEEDQIDQWCEQIRARVAREPMTPRQRFEAVARGEEVDRVPIVLNVFGLHVASNYGVRPSDVYANPKTSAMAYIYHLARFGYDTFSPFRFSNGHAEFGGEMVQAEYSIPIVKKAAVETMADIEKVKIPDPRKDDSLPWMLWEIGLFKKKLGDIIPIYGFMGVPGVGTLMTMDKQFLAFRAEPELAHVVQGLSMRFAIEFGNAQFAAGADYVRLVGVSDWISYRDHREMEFPYTVGLIKSLEGPVFTIGSGDWTHQMASFAEAGVVGWHVYGRFQPLEPAKEIALRCKKLLRYGLNSKIILEGPESRIREHVKDTIKRGWPGGYFVLDSEPLDIATPPEHVDVVMDAAREYARLPLRI